MTQPPFFHEKSIVEPGAQIGERTTVWAFSHVLPGAQIGSDCNLNDHTFVEGGVKIGNRVTLKCGVYLWKGLIVDDDVFIGPSVVFTNDLRPRSKQYPSVFKTTHLKTGCSLGANSTILPVTVGHWAMVAAGAVVTRDVPDYALVVGQPAKFHSWVCRCGENLCFDQEGATTCQCGRHFRKNGDVVTPENSL